VSDDEVPYNQPISARGYSMPAVDAHGRLVLP
jgi:hypothetical protein